MKLSNQILTVILLFSIVEIQCGLIDNIFGKVKNTTDGLRQDVKNVWSFSKSVVGIKTPVDNRPEEEKRGFVGGIVYSTKQKVHNIKNYFWNTDNDSNDAGLFGNMYNRVLNNLSRVKGSILGDNQTPRPPSDKEKLVQKTLDKLFFGNGTRKTNGKAFQQAIDNLKKKLQEIRDSAKKEMENPVHHGEGLIDVRVADVRDKTENTYNNIKNEAGKAADSISNGANNAVNKISEIRDNALDTAARERELLQNSFISSGAPKVSTVENAVEDGKQLSY